MYPIRSTKMAKGRPCSATRYAKTDIVSADYRAWLRLSPAAPTPPASASPLAPSSIVSVPLALAPVVVCFQVRVLPDELNAKPRRSISSPRWKPEIVPETCPPESTWSMPPLEKTTPLPEPPDATSSVPPLITVAMALPPLLTSSYPPLETIVPLARPPPKTVSWPPRSVAEVVPPDETVSVAPLDTVVLQGR